MNFPTSPGLLDLARGVILTIRTVNLSLPAFAAERFEAANR